MTTMTLVMFWCGTRQRNLPREYGLPPWITRIWQLLYWMDLSIPYLLRLPVERSFTHGAQKNSRSRMFPGRPPFFCPHTHPQATSPMENTLAYAITSSLQQSNPLYSEDSQENQSTNHPMNIYGYLATKTEKKTSQRETAIRSFNHFLHPKHEQQQRVPSKTDPFFVAQKKKAKSKETKCKRRPFSFLVLCAPIWLWCHHFEPLIQYPSTSA